MSDKHSMNERLVNAYNHMLNTLHRLVSKTGKQTGPVIEKGLQEAREAMSELDELGREDLEKVSNFLRRDIESAGEWLGEHGHELKDWARFDLALAEQQLLSAFSNVADRTTFELKQLEMRAAMRGEWHTGEITTIGTLTCTECGEELHFHHTGHIPPCPKCKGTRFTRSSLRD
ncbi:MAG: zinc ribbon-containing protein [Granulosicoccaceae bacterium]|jgi:hypothetical protein